MNRTFRFSILLFAIIGSMTFIYLMGGIMRYQNHFSLVYFLIEIFVGSLLLFAYFRREHGISQVAVRLIVKLFIPRWEEWVAILGFGCWILAIFSLVGI